MASTGKQQRPSVVGGGGHYAFREKCRRWNELLLEADAFSGLVSVCQNICSSVGRSKSGGKMSQNAAKTDEMASTETDENGPDDIAGPVAALTPVPVEEKPEEKLCQSLGASMCDKLKTHAQRKILSKAHYSLCYESLQLGLIELGAISGIDDLDDSDLNSVAIFGMLNSCFLRHLRTDPGLATKLATRNLTLFLGTCNYSRFFNTLAENVLTFERMLPFSDAAGMRARYLLIWKGALMNLESPYHGTRENMYALIKWVARDDPFMRATILPDVSGWSWMNRNKLHVLGVLLIQYRLGSLMEGLKLNQALLAEGVMLSLRYKHLHTGGQMLVRLLLRDQQMAELVYEMVVHVVREWDVEQLMAMGKYWFSSFEPRDSRCVYELLELERILSEAVTRDGDGEVKQLPAYLRANRHEKLFHLALFFRRELHAHPYLPQYLMMLCELAEGDQPGTPDAAGPIPAITRGMLIEALGYHITNAQPAGTENVINVLQFTKKLAQHVLEMIETPAATKVCTANAVVCQRLLRHIVSTQATFDKDAQAVVTKLMSYEMYDRYLLPVGPTKQLDYQPTIIALRMFSCFVNVFFEFTPSSQHVLQTRPTPSIQWIVKLLPASLGIDDLASSFRSMVYGLQHLFRCDFEDVRTITLQMLYNKGYAYNFDPALQGRLGELFSRNDPTELGQVLTAMLNDTLRRLRAAIVAHQEDFYAATLEEENDPNTQLYRLVDRLTEIVFGEPDRSPEVMKQLDIWSALRCVVLVIELVLKLLNAAKDPGESAYTGTSFSIMEQSLQMLLDKSELWNDEYRTQETDPSSAQVALARRCLMRALWKAVRSTATALECCALWMVDQYLDGAKDKPYLVRIAEYLQHLFNITIQCCHRGAIEAAGTSLGRIARRITKLRQTVLSVGTTDAPSETRGERFVRTRNIVVMFEGFFRNCLKEHKLTGNDFRRYRGYLWAIHCCIRSEIEGGGVLDGSLMRIFLDEHVELGAKTCTVVERELTDRVRGFDCEEGLVGVLELHQLNLLARESSLSDAILPQIDDMLLMGLTHFNHPDFEVRNASVQLYASCLLKLTGQPQQYRDPHCDWPPVAVSLDEILRKLPATLGYAVLKLQRIVNGGRDSNRYNRTTPFILLVLELLSKVEYRAYQQCERSLVLNFRAIIWHLLRHENEKVRTMAARCYAQLHDFRTEIPGQLQNMVVSLFTSAKGENFRHGLCQALENCVRKQVTHGRFIAHEPLAPCEFRAGGTTSVSDWRQHVLNQIRDLITTYYQLDDQLQLESPYRFRCALLGLLLYVGFERRSNILMHLVYNRIATNSHGLEVFLMQANRIFGTGTVVPYASGRASAREQNWEYDDEDAPPMPYEIELEPQPHDDNDVYEELDDN